MKDLIKLLSFLKSLKRELRVEKGKSVIHQVKSQKIVKHECKVTLLRETREEFVRYFISLKSSFELQCLELVKHPMVTTIQGMQ